MPPQATPLAVRLQDWAVRALDVRRWVAATPPWLASLLVHGAVLGALAGITATIPAETRPVILETRLEDNEIQQDFSPTLNTFQLTQPASDTASSSTVPEGVSVGRQLGTPSFATGSVPGPAFGSGKGTAGPMQAIDTSRLTAGLAGPGGMAVPTGVRLDKQFAVRGGSDVTGGAGGVAGAIDRITYEIARSLDERKTLVIWLFDATGSLKPQMEEIAQRVDRVYEELGVLKNNKDKRGALLTAVVAFGEKYVPMTAEPTDDLETVKKAMRSIKDDDSGTENTFSAISSAIQQWGKYRTADKRNILVIAVTDEKGDDEAKVDETIEKLKRVQAKVYVVGAYAPLGRTQVMLPWPTPAQVRGYVPADRGPESARIENGALPFWYATGGGLENLSSGFGPWGLARLCRDSGGIFFIMHEDRTTNFDPVTLREYQPDYTPRKEYDRLVNTHPLRRAVIEAAETTQKGPKQLPNIPLEFAAPDDATLNRGMGGGQAVVAKLQYYVEEPLRVLLQVEKDRAKEPSRRWRAEYDLLLGRLLAAKIRTYTYNAMCAQMKKKPRPFEKTDSNYWALRPDSEVPGDTMAGAKLQEAAEKCRQYLTRVVAENPDTPWALLAQRELEADLGFHWQELHRNIPKPGSVATTKATPKPAAPSKPSPPPPAIPKKI